jgi:hypothetical protein
MRNDTQTVTRPGRLVRRRTSVSVLAVILMTISAAAQSDDASRAAAAETLPALQDPPLEQYRAYRRMHAVNEKFNQEAWLECWTEFDKRGFRYEVTTERGSDYILEKVLRTLLRREQELIAQGEAERADLTTANYEFVESTEQNDRERYVLLKPKRKDVLLVDGRMVLNQDGTDLLRVEGRLSKNPSFWTSLVKVMRQFARLDGIRVPIATESVAKLKFAGMSRMQVRYEYESINGRPVSVPARRMMAAAFR